MTVKREGAMLQVLKTCRLLIAMAIICVADPSAAKTLSVPGQYGTIQAAVNAAGSGDVIEVSPGEYRESVTFLVNYAGKTGITLKGLDRNTTVIRPVSGRGIYLPLSNSIRISSLTVTGGVAQGTGPNDPYGGGIFLDGSTGIEISDCVIKQNVSAHGGGIAIRNSSASVMSNVIAENTAEDPSTCQASGGGLFVYNHSQFPDKTVVISGNQIVNNRARTTVITPPDGPGSSNPRNCMALGGGVFHQLSNRTPNLNDPMAFDGGDPSLRVAVSNNLFRGNTTAGAQHYGGAMYLLNSAYSQAEVVKNTFSDNTGLDGGGVAALESNVKLSYNRFYNNQGRWGGALYGYHMSSHVEGNIFHRNLAKNVGCPDPSIPSCSGGGAVQFDISDASPAAGFIGNLVTENSSDAWGGGIDLYVTNYPVEGNKISGNIANMGGGVIVNTNDGQPSHPRFTNNIVADNRAVTAGNSMGWGGGIGIGGSTSQTGLFANNLIVGNRADYAGGGITVYGEGRPDIVNNTIHNNRASRHFGGGIRLSHLSPTVSAPAIMNNIISGHDSSEGISSANVTVVPTYNNLWGNLVDYEFVTSGAGSKGVDPRFVNVGAGDFRLSPVSQCINSGNPDPSYDNGDGSRNDMGMYGGPAAFSIVFPERLGLFRNGIWLLDYNGDRGWSGCAADRCYSYGFVTDVPIAGDWNGDGRRELGTKRGNSWYLDYDGSETWSGCVADKCSVFGLATDLPVIGNWGGFGPDKIGAFRNGTWILDYNGNGIWDSCGTTPDKDRCYTFGAASDAPVVGDWNGDGISKIGVRRGSNWYLDYNGNGAWEGCVIDRCYALGLPADIPVVGDWNWDGHDKIGAFRRGTWYVDYNGNGVWEGCTIDRCYTFGRAGDRPFVGRW